MAFDPAQLPRTIYDNQARRFTLHVRELTPGELRDTVIYEHMPPGTRWGDDCLYWRIPRLHLLGREAGMTNGAFWCRDRRDLYAPELQVARGL